MVRKIAHGLGFRYRLHASNLPGRPDLVFSRLKKIIEVQGCFWHQHPSCRDGRIPGSRAEYWVPKLKRNQVRDAANKALLEKMGWNVLVVWECESKDRSSLFRTLKGFLGRS